MPADHLGPVPGIWLLVLPVTGLVLFIYGVGLIVRPEYFSGLFPWKLDVFHSQLYGATFLAGNVMMAPVARVATGAEFVTAGMAEAVFGIFSILGLIIVDAGVQKIDWLAPNSVIWLAALGLLAALGIAMIIAGRRDHWHRIGD